MDWGSLFVRLLWSVGNLWQRADRSAGAGSRAIHWKSTTVGGWPAGMDPSLLSEVSGASTTTMCPVVYPSDPLRDQSMEAATKLLEGQKIALAVDNPFLLTCLAYIPKFRNRVCWAVTT